MKKEPNVEMNGSIENWLWVRPSHSHLVQSEETGPFGVRGFHGRLEDEDCEPGQIKPTDELQRKQSLLKTWANAQKALGYPWTQNC